MTDIQINFVNNVNVRVTGDFGIMREIAEHFSFYAENYKFHPKVKAKIWDGKIKMLNSRTGLIYNGLWEQIVKFCVTNDYTYTIDPDISARDNVTPERLQRFIDALKLPDVPYDYQFNAVMECINSGRKTVESPTGSGKSLIQYILMRWLSYHDKQSQMLLVVPTVGLVSQMMSDFGDYSVNNGWDVEKYCHQIFAGQDKLSDKRITISTWQSIYKLKGDFFDRFEIVFIDECHEATAKSLVSIMDRCSEAYYRFGFTGSLDGVVMNEWTLCGLFGSVYKTTTTKELMDDGKLTPLLIKCCRLIYSEDIRRDFKTAVYGTKSKSQKTVKYIDEVEWLLLNEKRNKFISGLASNLDGNTLIFFVRSEHGRTLEREILEVGDKKVFFINKDTKPDEREFIRNQLELEDNCILLASSGTSARGINIKKIHNMIFAHPTKSLIRVVQSIGRGLRMHISKDRVVLFDIIDDITWGQRINYGMKHFLERFKIYAMQKFEYKQYKFKI